LESYNYPYQKIVIVLICRADIVDRTRQIVEDFVKDIPFDTLNCTGKCTQIVTEKMQELPDKKYLNFESKHINEVEHAHYTESNNSLIFCVGIIQGPGKQIAQYREWIY